MEKKVKEKEKKLHVKTKKDWTMMGTIIQYLMILERVKKRTASSTEKRIKKKV